MLSGLNLMFARRSWLFSMVHHKLLFINGLLILLLYSGYGLYTAFVVFTITVVTSYICYTLNTQLRLDGFFKFLIYFGIGAPKPVTKDEEDNALHRKNQGLQTFPKPIRETIQKFIDSIVRDFITSWYVFIGPDEEDFIEEVKSAIEYAVTEVALNLEKADIHNTVVNLIRMFQRHVKVFDDYRTIVQKKYPGISDRDFSDCITELYEAGIIKHIATRSKGNELDYLKTLLDILLFKFLPEDAFSCEGGRFMLREILAIQLLEPLIDLFTQPHFVNQVIIDVLEPSIPLPIVIKAYHDAMLNDGNIESEHAKIEQISDPNDDVSGNETNYESSPEDFKSPNITQDSDSPSKFHSPKGSMSEFIDYENENEPLRFNHFDRTRTSAPVYGSKSARDHEKSSKHRKTKNTLPTILIPNTDNQPNKAENEQILDSGRASRRSFSMHEYNLTTSNELSPTYKEPWNSCPDAKSEVFRNNSFNEMPRHQDNIHEQLKAKVRMISLPSSCIDPCGYPKQRSRSVEGSVTMDFSKKGNTLEANLSPSTVVTPSISSNDEVLKIHSSGKEGAFYEVAPSCPTCIEMTMLASPFENDKAKLIPTLEQIQAKKVQKIKVDAHECGLEEEHYTYAETENEIIAYEPLDDISFESCEDDINDLTTSFSSGTLLASGETFETSINKDMVTNNDDDDDDDEERDDDDDDDDNNGKRGMDSYDVLSLLSQDSLSGNSCDISPDSASFEDLDMDGNPTPHKQKKFRHRAESVQTYKTAIEGSLLSDQDLTGSKLKHKKPKTNNFFDKFFKSGLPSIRRRQRTLSGQSSDSNNEGAIKKSKHRRHHSHLKRHKKKRKKKTLEDGIPINEASSLSTSITKFNSIPESSSYHPNWPHPRRDSFVGSFIEEVGLEVGEDEHFSNPGDAEYLSEEFKDAPSQMYPSSLHSVALSVDPLTKEITVTEKDLPVEARSIKSIKSMESNEKTTDVFDTQDSAQHAASFIPIFDGEVIMPHPSKIPATWLYPIQMVSIPTTEVAYEKGWEPGINKYTLYSVHYDIRIWPDYYQKQIEDQKDKTDVPVIREIKRRYREFLYLHNRLTHGHLSKFMKGILRPNRRYAMPFGRMDPDVIEGRRKILETYLVSVVSRPELCNSREFKDFLGSEGNDDLFEARPKKITQKKIYKQKVNEVVTAATEQHGVTKEHVFHSGLNSQYFIHGYERPRMFGYCQVQDVKRHAVPFITYFTENYPTLKEDIFVPKLPANVTSFEPIQRPTFYIPNDTVEWTSTLGPRTAGDGAEKPDEVLKETNRVVTFDDSAKKYDGNMLLSESQKSLTIAAKFSEELASQLLKEKEYSALEIKREKDLYESSWPLTDAVLSIASQALKSYESWLTYGRVQQAVLFSLGGIIEWLISRELNEVLMIERCYKYLKDLYNVVWDKQDKLKEKEPEPTNEEKKQIKEEALQRIMDIIPSFLMMSVGPTNYRKCCENLLHTLQYPTINRHVLYAALEIILEELIPELQTDFEGYVEAAKPRP